MVSFSHPQSVHYEKVRDLRVASDHAANHVLVIGDRGSELGASGAWQSFSLRRRHQSYVHANIELKLEGISDVWFLRVKHEVYTGGFPFRRRSQGGALSHAVTHPFH